MNVARSWDGDRRKRRQRGGKGDRWRHVNKRQTMWKLKKKKKDRGGDAGGRA